MKYSKVMVLYSFIVYLIVSIGCQEQKEFSLSQIVDTNKKTNKPVLVFMANHNSSEYEGIRRILNRKEVKQVLKKFVFLEVNTLKDNYFNKIMCSCVKNMFLVIEGDSISSTINSVTSSSMLIYKLNNYKKNKFAETVKYCSLLEGDSQLVSVEINRIMRAQYLREKKLMSQDEYKSILISTIKRLPYFYNRYLLLKEKGKLTRAEVSKCTDSLSLFEKKMYFLEIKELVDRMFSVNTKSKINFDITEFNFGIVMPDSIVCHTFYFTNEGKGSLILYNVEASCGCMAVSWPRVPIHKGEKDSISISFKGVSHGHFCKSIKVMSNSDSEVITLYVSGKVDK